MFRKLFYVCTILAMVFGMTGLATPPQAVPASVESAPVVKVLEPVHVSSLPMAGTHLVSPRDEVVVAEMKAIGTLSMNSTQEEIDAALDEYRVKFSKLSSEWVNPQIANMAQAREEALASGVLADANVAVQPVTATIFAVNVEFATGTPFVGTDCDDVTVAFDGPQQGDVPAPGSNDNVSLWYTPTQTASMDLYRSLVFGYAGVTEPLRTDLNGGAGVDVSGYTVQDYYDKVAGATGLVTLEGDFFGWYTVPQNEAFYGAPNCDSGTHDANAKQLVMDAMDAFSAANPGFDWSAYDGDGDHIVDTTWVLHAGEGQEVGGGEQGGFALWSHSSDLRYYLPDGYQVAGTATVETTDDYFVGPYTMNPEMADIGVLAEEFGHNVFGLPDMYTTDAQNSVGFWGIMSAGSYGGEIAGMSPVGMPLWFRMIAYCGTGYCNWQYPMATLAYTDPVQTLDIGTLEDTPGGTLKGVRINLPAFQENIPNNAGDGKGAWTTPGLNQADMTLERDVTIGASAAGVFTFDSSWDIEEDWDYGYVTVTDGTVTTFLQDMDGVFTDSDPNTQNLGWALTGTDAGTLRFDLSAYKGKTVTLTIWYRTDAAVTQNGWWVDNVQLDGVLVDDFSSASGTTFPGWTNSNPGWQVTPSTKNYTNYYLLEWRGETKYDKMVKTAYVTTSNDENGWNVARVPYNIPGGLLYYRNTKYPSSYSQRGSYGDAPSYGPKNKLLVVDMNEEAVRFTVGTAAYSLNNRVAAYDATIALQDAPAWSANGISGATSDTVNFAAVPYQDIFDDFNGKYPGFLLSPTTGGLYYAAQDSSVVIPARGDYSTRLRWRAAGYPDAVEYYGEAFAPTWFGSGNPGDEGLAYGVGIVLTSKNDGSYGTFDIGLRNPLSVKTAISYVPGVDGWDVTYAYLVTNNATTTVNFAGLDMVFPAEFSLSSINIDDVVGAGDVNAMPPSEVYVSLGDMLSGSQKTVIVKGTLPTAFFPDVLWTSFEPSAPGYVNDSGFVSIGYKNTYNMFVPIMIK